MPQDWIEFKTIPGENGSLRPEYIYSIVGDNKTTTITYSDTAINVAEPYEQVKQKIMDADKIDYSNVIVEHFTKDEYELLEYCLAQCAPSSDSSKVAIERYAKLQNKLNKILMEDK